MHLTWIWHVEHKQWKSLFSSGFLCLHTWTRLAGGGTLRSVIVALQGRRIKVSLCGGCNQLSEVYCSVWRTEFNKMQEDVSRAISTPHTERMLFKLTVNSWFKGGNEWLNLSIVRLISATLDATCNSDPEHHSYCAAVVWTHHSTGS